MAGLSDTTRDAHEIVIDGLRRMSPSEKLARVAQLNGVLVALASARIRAQYGAELPPAELRLRLAAVRLDPDIMRTAFQWDPAVRGL
jgi:hypothetical protein